MRCKNKKISTEIILPPSKSICNRLLIMRTLCKRTFKIRNLSGSDDTVLLKQALESADHVKDVGHAGTAMRFLAACLATREGRWVLTGSERMKQRPIGPLVDALRNMGADIVYQEKEGFPPLVIRGKKLRGGILSIDSSISSQFVSALLMIAPATVNGLELTLENKIISSPYIGLTLGLMEKLGIRHQRKGRLITVMPQSYRPVNMEAEPDWTAASYWYEIACLADASKIFLPGLKKDSLQGDAALTRLMAALNVMTVFKKNGVLISKRYQKFKPISIDFTGNPDLVQTFTVLSAMKGIPFTFTGTKSLQIKETDRVRALGTELMKFGIHLSVSEDGNIMEWDGRRQKAQTGPIVLKTYDDHRMAMAFAPVALLQEIGIESPGVVQKSYPGFWEDIEKAGFVISTA